MKKFIRKLLTRRVQVKSRARKRVSVVEVPPGTRLLYGTILIIVILAALVVLEIAHLLFLHEWNSQVFSAVTGLVGMLVGLVLERRG